MGLLPSGNGHRTRARAEPAHHGRAEPVAGRAARPWLRDAVRPHTRGRGRRVMFEEARAMFPALERVAYLNAGTFGPLARQTVAVMLEQLERDLERGRVRGAIATLLSAEPERVSLTSSTTDGCNIVLLGLGLERDDEIVTTDT